MNYFFSSYLVTIVGLVLAYFWGEHVHQGSGLTTVFIAFVLSVLEVSLSFDNAVVNAMKLEKMNEKWRRRFLTWGIAIAVFGMRFLFPVLVVAVFAHLGLFEVVKIALTDSKMYEHYLHLTHAPIVSFGGTFLMMLFLDYFINDEKELHWLKWIEKRFKEMGNIKGAETIVTLIFLFLTQHYVVQNERLYVVLAGIFGVVIYLLIDGITQWLEQKEEESTKLIAQTVKGSGLMGFLYLELIDASFSLDGVLGAFALSKDILIITIGLSIGAMFVRSLTMMLVEKKTLGKYLYLEHGAHWAIGALSLIMLVSTFYKVNEILTGSIGLIFIAGAFISSLIHNKKLRENVD
ncbi:MAG TPA: DUF475 domain-containing protein [Candidatus Gastranaerophilaceae bacterium]|nr:DUF475 domain-containing protein [Candidatus Gastranaerophilaceae bacterium]HPT42159.1 DUF475 domain-containing protein [Candidatus Gastranaerophilaceae bacterium]